MDDVTEARILRARVADLRTRLDQLGSNATQRTALQVGKIYAKTSLPTTPGVFYAAHPATVTPATTEGGAATIAVDTGATFYTRVLRTNPPADTLVMAASVDYRWQAEYATSGHPFQCCSGVTLPATLTLTLSAKTIGIPSVTTSPGASLTITYDAGSNTYIGCVMRTQTAGGAGPPFPITYYYRYTFYPVFCTMGYTRWTGDCSTSPAAGGGIAAVYPSIQCSPVRLFFNYSVGTAGDSAILTL